MNPLALIKKKTIIVVLVLLLAIALFFILNNLRTPSKLSEDKFAEVYVQLSIASEMYESKPVELEQERKKILEKYDVTQDEIDHFIEEYNQDPERWARVWEKIVRKLEEEKGEANPP